MASSPDDFNPPSTRSNPPARAIDSAHFLAIDDEPLDVLIIDDDYLLRTVLASSLSDAKYSFRCAADGQSALGLLTQRRFKLVVTDLYMPTMDGFEVITRYIAADPAAMILAMSGGGRGSFDREITLKSALLLGSYRSLPKPFTAPQFIAIVEEMIGPPLPRLGSTSPHQAS